MMDPWYHLVSLMHLLAFGIFELVEVFLPWKATSSHFSPNGYHLATGGEDNTCRIWDLRKKKFLCIIPAHSNLVSQVKYEPQEGYFLVTASFDMIAKIWSARDVKPVKSLSGHEAKVTSLDIISVYCNRLTWS
ncbi:hypothetical protein IC582_005836 [Cucumis melo]